MFIFSYTTAGIVILINCTVLSFQTCKNKISNSMFVNQLIIISNTFSHHSYTSIIFYYKNRIMTTNQTKTRSSYINATQLMERDAKRLSRTVETAMLNAQQQQDDTSIDSGMYTETNDKTNASTTNASTTNA